MARPTITPIEKKQTRPTITPIQNTTMQNVVPNTFSLSSQEGFGGGGGRFETEKGVLPTVGRSLTSVGQGFLGATEKMADALQYGVANVAGLVGADKTKKALIDNAKFNSTEQLTKTATDYYDPKTIKGFRSGEFGDKVGQGVGQIAAIIGGSKLLGKAGTIKAGKFALPTPSIAMGYGGGTTEGLEKGNSFGKSQLYGLGSGLIESSTEALSGGIGGVFGKGAIDDLITAKLVSKVSGKIAKNLTEIGVKAGFEGLEENISGFLNPYLQRMTIDKNAESYFRDEDGKFTLTKAGEDFLVGSVTSALLQSPSVTQNNADTQTNVLDNTNMPNKQEQTLNAPQIEPNEALQPNKQLTQQLEDLTDQAREDFEANDNINQTIPTDPTKATSYSSKSSNNDLSFDINERIDKIKNIDKEALLFGFQDNKVSLSNDIYRNVERGFNKEAAKIVQNEVLKPLDQAKLKNVQFIEAKAVELRQKLNEWGIEKGSKDSALIQKYGEKQISLSQLQQSTKNSQNVIEADKWFRKQYDDLIDNINKSRAEIYPNTEKNVLAVQEKLEKINETIKSKKQELKNKTNKETKLYKNIKRQIEILENNQKQTQDLLDSEDLWRGKQVPKRDDYYRHFQEMAEGFKALRNIMTTPADIASNMVGISDFTKPNAKFLGLAQKRMTDQTKYDAVGGFLNYLKPASYAINIDPQIKVIREFARDMATKTKDKPQANKFIDYLNDYANTLAGKTNPIDRPFQKLLDRKTLKTMEWVASRIKSNAVLGNVSSSISQVLNLPQGIADVSNPVHLTKGLVNTIRNSMSKNNAYGQSQFITERYSDIDTQFDTKLLDKPKNFAKWMLNALDEFSTKFIWNAEYSKAVSQNIEDPLSYADNQTRKMVAGRGIGEKPITQESRIAGLVMPFTLEVGNTWRVMKDFSGEKEYGKLIVMFIFANLLNKGIKKIGAGGQTFDPIEAIKEALSDEETTILEKFGRLGGEVLSNVPLGQNLAAVYPEYGADLGVVKLPTRAKLFGENDPTRFGTGSVFTKAITDPATSLITPFGGAQIRKTKKGIESLISDVPGDYNAKGKIRYPISTDPINATKGLLFGSFRETGNYYDNNGAPLSENQTSSIKNSSTVEKDFNQMLKVREYNKLIREYDKLREEGKDTTNIEKKIRDFR